MERKFAELRKMKCVVCNEAGGVKVQCVHKRAPRPGPDQRAMARLDIAPDRKRRKKATSVGMHKSNRRDHWLKMHALCTRLEPACRGSGRSRWLQSAASAAHLMPLQR